MVKHCVCAFMPIPVKIPPPPKTSLPEEINCLNKQCCQHDILILYVTPQSSLQQTLSTTVITFRGLVFKCLIFMGSSSCLNRIYVKINQSLFYLFYMMMNVCLCVSVCVFYFQSCDPVLYPIPLHLLWPLNMTLVDFAVYSLEIFLSHLHFFFFSTEKCVLFL